MELKITDIRTATIVGNFYWTYVRVYAGDWFFDPSIGNRIYEIKTITEESLKRVQNYVEIALKRLVDMKLVKSFVDSIVRDTIKENKGKGITWRVGHSFIKEKMRKENILFAGELSGHYYHKKHYFCEAPLFVLFKIFLD